MKELKCTGCGRKPDEIEEYQEMAKIEKVTPVEFVKRNEGTLSHKENIFACTACYVRMGEPRGFAIKDWIFLM